jgi:hypothetical protein
LAGNETSRRLKFQKGSQPFIGAYGELLSVVAMLISDPDRIWDFYLGSSPLS